MWLGPVLELKCGCEAVGARDLSSRVFPLVQLCPFPADLSDCGEQSGWVRNFLLLSFIAYRMSKPLSHLLALSLHVLSRQVGSLTIECPMEILPIYC